MHTFFSECASEETEIKNVFPLHGAFCALDAEGPSWFNAPQTQQCKSTQEPKRIKELKPHVIPNLYGLLSSV